MSQNEPKPWAWKISYSFTQPYSQETAPQIYNRLSVEEELIRLDQTDNIVQNMLTYTDADAIIKKITKEMRND